MTGAVVRTRRHDHPVLGMVQILESVMIPVLIVRRTFDVVIVRLGGFFRGNVEAGFRIRIRTLMIRLGDNVPSTRSRHGQIRGILIVGTFRHFVPLVRTLRWQS